MSLSNFFTLVGRDWDCRLPPCSLALALDDNFLLGFFLWCQKLHIHTVSESHLEKEPILLHGMHARFENKHRVTKAVPTTSVCTKQANCSSPRHAHSTHFPNSGTQQQPDSPLNYSMSCARPPCLFQTQKICDHNYTCTVICKGEMTRSLRFLGLSWHIQPSNIFLQHRKISPPPQDTEHSPARGLQTYTVWFSSWICPSDSGIWSKCVSSSSEQSKKNQTNIGTCFPTGPDLMKPGNTSRSNPQHIQRHI